MLTIYNNRGCKPKDDKTIFYLLKANHTNSSSFVDNEIITHVLKPRSATAYDFFLDRNVFWGFVFSLFLNRDKTHK